MNARRGRGNWWCGHVDYIQVSLKFETFFRNVLCIPFDLAAKVLFRENKARRGVFCIRELQARLVHVFIQMTSHTSHLCSGFETYQQQDFLPAKSLGLVGD